MVRRAGRLARASRTMAAGTDPRRGPSFETPASRLLRACEGIAFSGHSQRAHAGGRGQRLCLFSEKVTYGGHDSGGSCIDGPITIAPAAHKLTEWCSYNNDTTWRH